MGGRGAESRFLGPEQCSLKLEQEKVIRAKAQAQEIGENIGQTRLSIAFRACICCKHYTIPVETEYETCSICGWIDDPFQNINPDSKEGMNPISLNEARKEYLKRI